MESFDHLRTSVGIELLTVTIPKAECFLFLRSMARLGVRGIACGDALLSGLRARFFADMERSLPT